MDAVILVGDYSSITYVLRARLVLLPLLLLSSVQNFLNRQ